MNAISRTSIKQNKGLPLYQKKQNKGLPLIFSKWYKNIFMLWQNNLAKTKVKPTGMREISEIQEDGAS